MKFSGAAGSFLQLTSANVATKITGLIAFGVFTRVLSTADLAFLPVYGMLTALSYVIFGFGLQPTLIRSLPGLLESDLPSAGRLIRMTTQILLVGTTIFGIGVYFIATPLAERLLGSASYASLIRLTAVGSCCFAWRNICHYLLWSAARFDKIAIVRAGAAFGRTTLGVTGLLTGGIEGLALGLVVNDALAFVLALVYSRDLLRIAPGPGQSHGKLIRESMPFYFESYLTYLRNQGDDWIVATMLGPAAMGVYFVAKRFPTMLMMFVESFDKIVTTQLSRRRDDHEAIRGSVDELVSLLVTVAVPGIFMIMGLLPMLIEVVAGPGFEAAVLPGMILCMMQLVRILAVPLSRGVFVTNPPMTRVVITTIESAFLIASLVLLVPLIAEPGVALSRFVAALAMAVCSFIVLHRTSKVRFPWGRMAVSTLLSAAMAATVLAGVLTIDSNAFSPLVALAGLIVFLLLTWMFQADAFITALEKALPMGLPGPLKRFAERRRRADTGSGDPS